MWIHLQIANVLDRNIGLYLPLDLQFCQFFRFYSSLSLKIKQRRKICVHFQSANQLVIHIKRNVRTDTSKNKFKHSSFIAYFYNRYIIFAYFFLVYLLACTSRIYSFFFFFSIFILFFFLLLSTRVPSFPFLSFPFWNFLFIDF